jgi:hypothetical protein
LRAGFFILPEQVNLVAAKPAGEKEGNVQGLITGFLITLSSTVLDSQRDLLGFFL